MANEFVGRNDYRKEISVALKQLTDFNLYLMESYVTILGRYCYRLSSTTPLGAVMLFVVFITMLVGVEKASVC